MGTKYVIDSGTMEKIADPLRSLAGRTDDLTPAEMEAAGNAAVSEVDDQTALLAQLEAVLAEKAAGGGGGIDTDSFRDARVIGGIFNWTPSTIIFTEGMTWADFCDSPWNVGAYDEAGPMVELKPFLNVHNGRVVVNVDLSPKHYLVRNDAVGAWLFYKEPQDGDVVVTPTDLIVSGVDYNARGDINWE